MLLGPVCKGNRSKGRYLKASQEHGGADLLGSPGLEPSTKGGSYRRIDLWFYWVRYYSQFSVRGIPAQGLGEMFMML